MRRGVRPHVGRDVRPRNGQSAADGVTPAPDSADAYADLDAPTAKPTRTDRGETDTLQFTRAHDDKPIKGNKIIHQWPR